jgi:hypothetical protein
LLTIISKVKRQKKQGFGQQDMKNGNPIKSYPKQQQSNPASRKNTEIAQPGLYPLSPNMALKLEHGRVSTRPYGAMKYITRKH